MRNRFKVREIAHHRNGISGAPFYVVRFTSPSPKNGLAVVFYQNNAEGLDRAATLANCQVAVFDADKLMANVDIAFGSNSWRGDHYADELIAAIETHEAALA